jgi:exonuclease VII large subunit
VAVRSRAVARRAPEGLRARQSGVRTQAARLGPLALGHLSRETERVRSWRRLLTAYDVERQLERGYSLTLTTGGQLVRSVADVALGTELVTRLADGTVHSRVERKDDHREEKDEEKR